jgi:hypothetical protein
MAPPSMPRRLRIVYDYHRQGESTFWRSSKTHVEQVAHDKLWEGPGIAISQPNDRLVEVTVTLEINEDDADVDEEEWEASQQADAAFQAHVPQANLGDPVSDLI